MMLVQTQSPGRMLLPQIPYESSAERKVDGLAGFQFLTDANLLAAGIESSFLPRRQTKCRCLDCKQRSLLRRRHARAGEAVSNTVSNQDSLPVHAGTRLPKDDAHSVITAKPRGRLPTLCRCSRYSSTAPEALDINFYSIEKTRTLLDAMQFYHDVFISSIHPHSEGMDDWQPISFYRNDFARMASDPMWMSATVAFAKLMKERCTWGAAEKSSEILKYSCNAVTDLRKRLSKDHPEYTDFVILTITTFMSIALATRDYEQLEMHIEGVERLISSRGGLKNVSFQYIKYKVTGFQTYWRYKKFAVATAPEALSYPGHPFSPKLCLSISRMSKSFAELALSGQINTTLITRLGDVFAITNDWAPKVEKSPEDLRRLKCIAYELEELLSFPTAGLLEYFITMATALYCISFDDPASHWLLVATIHIYTAYLSHLPIDTSKNPEVTLWLATVFIATTEPESLTCKLGQQLIRRLMRESRLIKVQALEVCRNHLWDEFFTARLKEKFTAKSDLSRWQDLFPKMTCSHGEVSLYGGDCKTTTSSAWNHQSINFTDKIALDLKVSQSPAFGGRLQNAKA